MDFEHGMILGVILFAGVLWLLRKGKIERKRRYAIGDALAIIDKWEARLGEDTSNAADSLRKSIARFRQEYDADEDEEMVRTRAEYVLSDFDRWTGRS